MLKLPYVLFAFFLLQTSSLAQRPEIHCKHFFFGYPFGTPTTNDLIIRDIYALSNNDDRKFADWVAYRLDPWTVSDRSDTTRNWRADPWLEENETLEPRNPDDYKDANRELGTDRGHQAPLASFKGSINWRETNYLSDITPQKAPLNQGPWKDLEDAVRELVQTWTTVWVMTGPLYERNMDELPEANEDHTVPSGYWKIVATGDPTQPATPRAVAFIMDQDTARNADFTDHIVTIEDIQQRSGLDFFWELPDTIETQLENVAGSWPLQ